VQTLRDYQKEALAAIDRQWESGRTSTIVSLFTGLGKTNVFIEDVYRRMRTNGPSRVLVVGPAHLTTQTYGRFLSTYPKLFDSRLQVQHQQFPALGMELANVTQPTARVVIGSVPTLIDRASAEQAVIDGAVTASDIETTIWGGVKLRRKAGGRHALVSPRLDTLLEYGLFDYIIYDETHHAVGDGSLVLITRLKEIAKALKKPFPKLVGYTATAWREDGRALGTLFETIAIHRGYEFGVRKGFLAPIANDGMPIKVHAEGIGARTAGIKATDWMFVLEKAWLEKARQDDNELRPTVAYFPSVEDSQDFAEFMRERGHNAAHFDGIKTIDGQGTKCDLERGREKVFNDIFTGKTRLLCNYAVLLEGVDVPPLSCILWARPTENAVITTQAIGRVLRLFEGNGHLPRKVDALILDAAGKQLSVIASGTLSGVKVDPYSGDYIKDDPVEKEVIYDGLEDLDVRDLKAKGQAPTSKGVSYSFGRILKRSGGDWHHDERTDTLSLGISETEVLVVTPPHYTFKTHLETVQREIEAQMVSDPDSAALRTEYIAVSEMAQMLGGYCLWSIVDNTQVDGFMYLDPNLDVTLEYAMMHINSREDNVGAFYKRSQKWRSTNITPAQESYLKALGVKDDISYYTCGQAAQRITHVKAYNQRLGPYLAKRLKAIRKYLPVLEKTA
jgi:superfamily II DNA or RNA helicase